jgi:HD-GYP domain-containing protein (c-di-GMP phosphodiesterase class II)
MKMLRKSMEGIIRAMSLTVEMRDPYTAGHQQRVADLAQSISVEMELSEERVEGVRMAGLIHDLGKIAVPAEILTKPGKLNNIEFNLIKLHPQAGYDILKDIEFPWPVAEIALQHHERMDGSGYPHGVKGEEILLESRIMAVADVVEAMASHRPYRAALGLGAAMEEIIKNKNRLFDLDVVDTCVKLFTDGKFQFKPT